LSLYDNSVIQRFTRAELSAWIDENLPGITEEEALAVLDNPYCGAAICGRLAQSQRLAGFYSVRLRLVEHRATPQAYAAKFIHYLYWFDLLRLSVNVTVPAPVRRAIDNLLLINVAKLSLGERISSARACSAALIKVFLFDHDPRVFAALLVNRRLREDDVLQLAGSDRASPKQLLLLAADRQWSSRYAVRRALAANPATPRAAAASQLRHLSRRDLLALQRNPATSVYLRRCIERMRPELPK
jgi:hypothetical protein